MTEPTERTDPPKGRALPTVVAVSLGWLFSAVDIILLILFQEEVAQALEVEVQTIKIAIGVGLMGSALGGLGFAPLGDRIGRVAALGWAVILYSVATAGMAFAPNVGVLMALRFLAGVGTGGEWSIGFALLAEVWSRKSRGAMGGLVAAMFNIGTFVSIGLYHSGLGWRGAFAIMVLPALGVAWLRRVVPESPVWLEFNEARKAGTLTPEMEAIVKRPPVVSAFRGDMLGLTMKAAAIFAVMNLGFYSFSTVFISYLQQSVADGGLGLAKADELPFHLALNIAGLVSVFVAGALSDRLGRRKSFSVFCGLGAAGFLWLSFCLGDSENPTVVSTALIMAFATCCMGFGINGVMGVLTPELYPTHLRSTGPGVCQNLGKGVGGLIGPPAAGALVLQIGYEQVLVLPGLVFLLLLGLIWWLPEVGGREVRGIEEKGYLDGEA